MCNGLLIVQQLGTLLEEVASDWVTHTSTRVCARMLVYARACVRAPCLISLIYGMALASRGAGVGRAANGPWMGVVRWWKKRE
mmetsp:Transcript_69257/g.137334  ORF Transcript_69257/g.137334 Transcript_69257/m.137334 type:complete len:83 (-) Transcript_69257:203-451(-)